MNILTPKNVKMLHSNLFHDLYNSSVDQNIYKDVRKCRELPLYYFLYIWDILCFVWVFYLIFKVLWVVSTFCCRILSNIQIKTMYMVQRLDGKFDIQCLILKKISFFRQILPPVQQTANFTHFCRVLTLFCKIIGLSSVLVFQKGFKGVLSLIFR